VFQAIIAHRERSPIVPPNACRVGEILWHAARKSNRDNAEPPSLYDFRGPTRKKMWDSNKNGVGQVIGFEQISDLPMSGLKEVTMAKKKKAKKKAKK